MIKSYRKTKIIVWLFALIAASVLFVSISNTEYAYADTDIIEYAVDGGTLKFDRNGGIIRGASGTFTELVIPEQIEGIDVTEIRGYILGSCKDMTSISLPSKITKVVAASFFNCPNLKEISVAENNPVYSSSDGVLYNKDKTVLISFPVAKQGSYTVPEGVTEIGDDAFFSAGITEVTLPESLRTVGKSAFSATKLKELVFPTNTITFGRSIVSECSELEKLVIKGTIIPPKGYSAGTAIITGCDNLKYLEIGSIADVDVDYFGYVLSRELPQLEQIHINDSDSVFVTENNVVFSKDKSKLICYPNGKKDTTYRIPDGVVSIARGGFLGNKNLQTLELPASISEIVFSDTKNQLWRSIESLPNLQSIQVNSGNRTYCSQDGVLYSADKTVLYMYPQGRTDDTFHIPDSVTACGGFPLDRNTYLKNIIVSENTGSLSFSGIHDLHVWSPADSKIKGWIEERSWTESAKCIWHQLIDMVKFDAAGGVVTPASKAVSYDEAIGELPTPVKSDAKFAGWYTAPEGGSKITSDYKPGLVSELTLYAHWLPASGYQLKDLTYSFENSNSAYRYPQGYKIPLNIYQLIFGNTLTAELYYDWADEWGGNCYGMSSTSGMFNTNGNGINITDFRSTAQNLSDLIISDKQKN